MPHPLIDLTGQVFGEWTVLRRAATRCATRHSYWVCRCACGAEREVSGINLRGGRTSRCVDCRRKRLRTDAVGKRYGRWLVLADAPSNGSRNRRVEARCDCGTQWTVYLAHLVSGRSTQCRTCGRRAPRI